MADPVTLSLIMGGVSAGAQGIAASQQAKAEREKAEINAYIGKTRAIQTGASLSQSLASELATMRAAAAANGQGRGQGAFTLFQSLNRIRTGEKRIAVANEEQGAADYRYEAAAAGARSNAALGMGLINAAPSMFDLYQYRSR
jgi:hypothetical protein